MEPAGTSIDLSEKLNLQPTFFPLNGLDRLLSSRQLSDPEEANARYEVDQSLRDANQRADLAYRLKASSVYRCYPGQVGIQRNCDRRPEDMSHTPDTGGASLSHP